MTTTAIRRHARTRTAISAPSKIDATAKTSSPIATLDTSDPDHRLEILLRLPTLEDNALSRTARRLQAPVLLSANALSRWTVGSDGLRTWTAFDTRLARTTRGRR